MKHFQLNKKALPLLALSLLLAAFACPANAAVTQIGTPTFATNTTSHSYTVPAGTNRILLVVISDDDGTDISSASFGALPMVKRAENSDGFAVDTIFTLSLGTSVTPTTDTITAVTNGSANLAFIGTTTFDGVDQSTPVGDVQSADGAGSTSTLNVTSAAGNLVFDVYDSFTGISGDVIAPSGGQTTVHNSGSIAVGGGFSNYGTSISPGGATVPMTWTSEDGQSFIHLAVSINAVPSASSVGVGGRVLTADGNPIRGALISITDMSGNTQTVQTGSFGNYRFEGIEVGQNYTLQVFAKRYSFANQVRVIAVEDEISDADFIADKR